MSELAGLAAAAGRRRTVPWALAWKSALSVVFSAVMLAQLAHHAMWRDELNAWAIALASPGLPDLFHNLHYDGHPGLWHLLLWLASWITAAPVTIKVVHGVIGLALIQFIIWRSPLTRGETLLLLLSYFVLFEYTVISRNYGIAMLLALIYAERRATHPEQRARNACLLGLLANTNVFALLLSGALAVEYALADRRGGDGRRPDLGRRWLLAGGVYGLLLMLAVLTMAPGPDMSWRTAGHPFGQAASWRHALTVFCLNLAALLPLQPGSFWRLQPESPDALWVRSLFLLATLALSPGLALVLWRLFAARRRLLLIPGLTFAAAVTFTHLIYPGSIRHSGVTFVALIAAVWIMRRAQPDAGRGVLLPGLLSLNAVAGLCVVPLHWWQPFSHAGDVAAWLRQSHLENATLLGTPDTQVAPVAILLGRPMTFLDCDCTDRYVRFLRRREDFSKDQVARRLVRDAAAAGPGPVVFISTRALTPAEEADIRQAGDRAEPLAQFDGALTDEDFVVYRIVRGGSP